MEKSSFEEGYFPSQQAASVSVDLSQIGIKTDTADEFYQNSCHNICRFYLIATGNWPYTNPIMKLGVRLFYTLMVSTFMFFQVCKFITAGVTVDLLIEIIPPLLFCLISLVRHCAFLVNDDRIKNLLEKIKDQWKTEIRDMNEVKILMKRAAEGKLYSQIAAVFCYTGSVLFLSVNYVPIVLDIILPLNESRPNNYPFMAEYFIHRDECFLPVLLHMQFSVLISITLIIAWDAIVLLYLLHFAGMFNILGYRLEHAFDPVPDAGVSETEAIFCRRLGEIVKLHTEVVQSISRQLDAFVIAYCIQIVSIVLALTGLLLQLHRNLSPINDVGLLLLTIARVVGHFLVVFLNFVPAQKVLNESTNMFHQAYNSKWYTAPLKSQILLLFILRRTLEPCKISIAKVLDMDFQIFAKIVQLTFSYFTVIVSIEE